MEKDKLDELLRRKSKNIKIPDDIDNLINNTINTVDKQIIQKNIVYKYVAVFVIVILISSLIFFNIHNRIQNNNNNENNVIANNNNINNNDKDNDNDNVVDYKNIIMEISEDPSTSESTIYYVTNPDNLIENQKSADYIVLAYVDKIIKSTAYDPIQNTYGYVYTLAEGTIKKVYKGNMNIGDEIVFYKRGGTISISEYEKTLYQAQIEKQGINKMSQFEKENQYIKVLSFLDGNTEIELNQQYLMYLKYNNEKKAYEVVGYKSGFREYDESTGLFKNNDTKQYEEFKLIEE